MNQSAGDSLDRGLDAVAGPKFGQRGAAASRSNTSKLDEVGMLISHNTRSGTDCTIAEQPSGLS